MNKIFGFIMATGFCVQCLILFYFSWVQHEQNDQLNQLSSKLEKLGYLNPETTYLVNSSLTQQGMVTGNDSSQFSSEQMQSFMREELIRFQNELKAELLDELSLKNSNTSTPRDDISDMAVQEANDTIDELYVNAIASGQWSDQSRTRLREKFHMATEEQRNAILDKLIIAVNNGDITTDGRSIF